MSLIANIIEVSLYATGGDYMSKVHVIYNTKGGSGKTTIAINIALANSIRGRRVLLIDLDRLAASTQVFCNDDIKGVKYLNSLIIKECKSRDMRIWAEDEIPPTEEDIMESIIKTPINNLHILPSHQERADIKDILHFAVNQGTIIKSIVDKVREKYDLILIDLSTTDDIITISGVLAGDILLVPVSTNALSLKVIDSTYNFWRNSLGKDYNTSTMKLIINRYYDTDRAGSLEVEAQIRECWPDWVLKNYLDERSGLCFNDLLMIAKERREVLNDELNGFIHLAEEILKLS